MTGKSFNSLYYFLIFPWENPIGLYKQVSTHQMLLKKKKSWNLSVSCNPPQITGLNFILELQLKFLFKFIWCNISDIIFETDSIFNCFNLVKTAELFGRKSLKMLSYRLQYGNFLTLTTHEHENNSASSSSVLLDESAFSV